MNYNLSSFIMYNVHIVNENVVTDLLSIGDKVNVMDTDPLLLAIIGGLSAHSLFEDNISMTRSQLNNSKTFLVMKLIWN